MRVGDRRRGLRPLLAPPADTGEEPIGSCAPQLDHQRAVRLFHLTVPGLDRVRQPGGQDAVLHASGFKLFHGLIEPFEPLCQGRPVWRAERETLAVVAVGGTTPASWR